MALADERGYGDAAVAARSRASNQHQRAGTAHLQQQASVFKTQAGQVTSGSMGTFQCRRIKYVPSGKATSRSPARNRARQEA